ncbi:MAG TPA: hypothetical protein VI504_14420 [Candidatus Eisenbacteria bacterium]|jgi:hypothetical protein
MIIATGRGRLGWARWNGRTSTDFKYLFARTQTAESQEIGLLRRELGYPTSGHTATREKFTAPCAGIFPLDTGRTRGARL